MISSVRSAGIYSSDQDRAKQFFTETLGFALIQDVPMGEGAGAARWIEVAPPDGKVVLVLYSPDDQKDRIGTFSNVLFTCDDIQQTYDELKAKGVEFTEAPSQQYWGWWAVFKDPDGNTYGLGQSGD
jgi:predicted enzyme related to lactoylglutathione lyase